MWHYVHNHQADLTLQGTICLTGYASIYQDGVICQYFQNSSNFHHLGVLFTIWQIHLLCYIIIIQHHSWDKFTYWQCTPCHIRLCQCVYQNDEYYVNYSKYKAWYAFLKQSVDSQWIYSQLYHTVLHPTLQLLWFKSIDDNSYKQAKDVHLCEYEESAPSSRPILASKPAAPNLFLANIACQSSLISLAPASEFKCYTLFEHGKDEADALENPLLWWKVSHLCLGLNFVTDSVL